MPITLKSDRDILRRIAMYHDRCVVQLMWQLNLISTPQSRQNNRTLKQENENERWQYPE